MVSLRKKQSCAQRGKARKLKRLRDKGLLDPHNKERAQRRKNVKEAKLRKWNFLSESENSERVTGDEDGLDNIVEAVRRIPRGRNENVYLRSIQHNVDTMANAKKRGEIERELRKIKDQRSLSFDIEIDGGINFDNNKLAIEAGANILVSGTTVFKNNNGNIKKNIDLLKLS